MGFVDWLTGLCYAITFRRDSCTGPKLFDQPVRGMLWCARCGLERAVLYPAPCTDHPEQQDPLVGRYPCPDCGAPLFAGFPHPLLCRPCIARLKGLPMLPLEPDAPDGGALLWTLGLVGVALVLAVAWWLR
jgi:hypothetical protein